VTLYELDTYIYIFFKNLKKNQKNHKMTRDNYCSQSVNYFNDVSEKDQIE